MTFTSYYEEEVVKSDIPSLSGDIKLRIKHIIYAKLATEPEKFGKPLRRSLKGYRSLRIGDYRVVYRIEAEKKAVKIFIIMHRSKVYEEVVGRVG